MPGGYMHLESMGDIDDYLFVNPVITYFKANYKRHTNFSQELIEIHVQGNYGFGNKHTVVIPRNGDLVGDLFLEVKLSNTDTHCYGLGNALIEYVELEICGQRIERIDGNYMNIIGEQTQTDEKRVIWDKFVGNNTDKNCKTMIIPLPFFCSNPGKYLQLVAMSYHEVRINIKFADNKNLMLPADCKIESVKLNCNYTYLDTDERKRVAQTSSEFLISSMTSYGYEKSFTIDALNPISTHIFNISHGNHPTSEVFWVIQNENGQPCQSVCLHDDKYAQYSFHINKNLAYEYKPLEYAHIYNPYLYNTNTPRTGNIYVMPTPPLIDQKNSPSLNGTNISDTGSTTLLTNKYLKNGNKYNQYIYSHSFALKPDDNGQSTGTINYSRLDNFALELRNIKLEPGTYVFKFYYKFSNVLKYASGMAELVY